MFLRTHMFHRLFRYIGAVGFAALILATACFQEKHVVKEQAEPELTGPASRVAAQLAVSQGKFKTAEEWKARRASLREGFLRGAKLWPLPEMSTPKAIIHSNRTYPGYSVKNIAIETMPGFYCVGNLYSPTNHQGPHPVVLCPHGHFPGGRFRPENQIVSGHLARMGAIAFSYSMVGWQDSNQTTHEDPNVLALQTWNSLRVVDYLSSLKEVDHTRIGVTGASGGGSQAIFLTLIDDRIAASAPVVILYGWSWFSPVCSCERGMPVMRNPETNDIELAAVAAPRPQLIITAGASKNFATVGVPFIQNVYRILGQPDHVSNVHFADEGHDFGPSKRKEVYAFFAKYLGLNLLDENLNSIPIETPKALEVFTARHPRPRNALEGSEKIARKLNRLMGD